jgi:hypothetical protein
MAFVYSGSSMEIRDSEAGAALAKKMRYGDTLYPSRYVLKYGDLECDFDVLYGESVSYTNHNAYGKAYTDNATATVYVLDNSLRRGLSIGFQKTGHSIPTEADYNRVKGIIIQGLTALFTKGGDTLKYIPGGNFRVEFETNMKTFASKHPGKLKNFNPDHYPGLPSM